MGLGIAFLAKRSSSRVVYFQSFAPPPLQAELNPAARCSMSARGEEELRRYLRVTWDLVFYLLGLVSKLVKILLVMIWLMSVAHGL